ncbi:MAG: leucyl/phenylalanyl-tRNA--protein transferase [Ferruginibacter sp.]
MVFKLNKTDINFPHPSLAEPDGLLAIGGDLTTERLVSAYENGIFPWYSEGDPVCWFSPHRRCVIFPKEIFISHSMKKIISQNSFSITTNTCFEDVIENCRSIKRKLEHGTWITNDMKEAYIELHHLGVAHSVEAWQDGKLAGGMYGVVINNIFCGESMFSKISNASKAVMIWICSQRKYKLLDCQLANPHLLSMGARLIEQKDFLKMLKSK